LAHVQVRLAELAEKRGVGVSEVPVVRSWTYSDGDGYLGSESMTVISGGRNNSKGKDCENAVSAIDIEASNFGKTVQVCLRTTACRIHWKEAKQPSANGSSSAKSDEEAKAQHLDAHRTRREEIWNAKVADVVRVRVFKLGAEAFERKFNLTSVGTEFVPQLIAKFWRMTSSGDSNNLKNVVKSLLKEWLGDSGEFYVSESRSGIETIKGLKRSIQFRILFLLIHGHKGTLGYNNGYSSQAEVRAVAKEFKVDYPHIDAEVRLELSAKKHVEAHKAYLESVTANKKDAEVPRLFCPTWKPGD